MQNKILYLEGKSGISGDMTVAALLDLGVDATYFNHALQSLKLEGVRWEIRRVDKNGITACDFNVILADEDGQAQSHNEQHSHVHHEHSHIQDHDHARNHEHKHAHGQHEHSHDHHGHAHGTHEHSHDHHDHQHEHEHTGDHDHGHAHGTHAHRNLADVCDLIDAADLTHRAKDIAKKIFAVVAQAEAKVHGKGINEVHFHEVGALDSIIDIVGVAVCLDYLCITKSFVSPLSEGSGYVTCQHGRLPVPVPATAEIAASYHMTLNIIECPHEMVTPTGIAIAAAIKTETALPQNTVIHKIGYGAGKRNLPHANVLRAMLLEATDKKLDHTETIWVLESNIDDSTGEQLGYAMEALLQAGALDVHYLPAFMKKNRPGWLLRVITNADHIESLEQIIYSITTTIGIRRQALERSCLEREDVTVDTVYGTAKVKKCYFGTNVFYYPEHESVKSLANASGVNYKTVADEIKHTARTQRI